MGTTHIVLLNKRSLQSLRWWPALVWLMAVQVVAVNTANAQPTEVFVMGMIHGEHRTSERWGLDEVRATIRALAPDVVCAEIPPANWPVTAAAWRTNHQVTDSRVRVFPEYVDVLLPLTDEMPRLVVEPCAGWTPAMARDRRDRMHEFETSTRDAAARQAYDQDEARVTAWLEAWPAAAPADDPFYIHSPAYDLRTKAELGPYEYHLNEVIGRPGGWTYINEEHFKLIKAAIARHPGQRVLITFGAGHKYWFLERLRQLPDVVLGDVRPYLPGAADHPVTAAQRAIDAFLLGCDRLGGDDLPTRFFVGTPQVEELAPGQWPIQAPVWRLAELPAGAPGRVEATRVPDASEPDGFHWGGVSWAED